MPTIHMLDVLNLHHLKALGAWPIDYFLKGPIRTGFIKQFVNLISLTEWVVK